MRVVVDSGLMRVPVYEPDVGLTRLETIRVSKANADQRRGRAGRVEPGICYRLWEEAATGGLQPYAAPEILSADLTGFLLDCALWGVADPRTLAFLDLPPVGALAEARALLVSIGALDSDGRITGEGRAVARLALPPRLARMVVDAAREGQARAASEIAVLMTERGLGGDAVDLASRLAAFRRDRSERAEDARRLARGIAARAEAVAIPHPAAPSARPPSPADGRRGSLPSAAGAARDSSPSPASGRGSGGEGALLASAYPERIAMARDRRGEFLMANGRAAALEPHDALAGEAFLAIGEIMGRASAARILLAAPLSLADIETVAGASIETANELAFDRASASLRFRRRRRLGALTLAEQPLAIPADDEAAPLMLARGVLELGLARLPWTSALAQWRERVMFLRRAEGEAWPDLSDETLASDPAWLAPFLTGKTRLDAIAADDLGKALQALLPWELARRLDRGADAFPRPDRNRRRHRLCAEGGPAIALKVQELFGLTAHPAVAGGRIPLTLRLLSPALRPIQITPTCRASGAARGARSGRICGALSAPFLAGGSRGAAPTARAKPRGT